MVSTNIRRQRQAAARPGRQDHDGAPRRRGAPDPARSSSAPGCSSTPTSTRPRPRPRRMLPDAVAAARKAGGALDGAAQEPAARRCRWTRPRRPRSSARWPITSRHARPVVGPGRRRGRRDRARGHHGPEPGRHLRRGLHARRTTSRLQHAERRSAAERRLRPGGGRGRRGRPGRARRSARRAGTSGEAASRSEIDLPGNQEELIQAIKATGKPFVVVLFNGRPLTLDGVDGRRARDPRGVVPGRRRPATRSPTSSSARSTRAASCPCRSRAGSGRCRSTTTTSRPAARATRARSTTRATATSTAATRSTCSATGSATASSRSPTCA